MLLTDAVAGVLSVTTVKLNAVPNSTDPAPLISIVLLNMIVYTAVLGKLIVSRMSVSNVPPFVVEPASSVYVATAVR